MSYSLALDSTGDLKQVGSKLSVLYGIDKLRQDLDIWFRERYQIDRFHLTYGSTLDNHIGSIVSALSLAQIKQEASRVMANYQKIQKVAFTKTPSKFGLDELISTVNSIQVKQSLDTIFIVISFTTAAGSQTNIRVGTKI